MILYIYRERERERERESKKIPVNPRTAAQLARLSFREPACSATVI